MSLLVAASSAMAAGAGAALSPSVLARTTPTSSSSVAQPSASPALQTQLALSAANLARAAQDVSNLNTAQAAASASSQLTLSNAALSGSSWNGTTLSGLNPRDSDPTLWINADRLQKNLATATATVKQNAANAVLTWQSFDLNKGETLVFDQQGNANWSVLNRVVAGPRDASGSRFVASPSMILGSIQAPGNVYVINPNGVIFGPTAQVNVHSLIASSLDVGTKDMTVGERNSFFLNVGILGSGGVVPDESFSYNSADKQLEGDVTVEAGAQITASLAPRSVSPDAGGFVYLFAPNVKNAGTISTPAGETMMVAAQAVQLIANAYPDASLDSSHVTVDSQFRAVGVNTSAGLNNGFAPPVWRTDSVTSAEITAPGQVTNNGLISAERGVVILNGDLVTNGAGGVIQANTSITRNAQIFLDARLQLTLAGGSIQILPDENGETIPVSAVQQNKFVPGSLEMHGFNVDMEAASLIEAPGANVSVRDSGKIDQSIYPDTVPKAVIAATTPRIYMAAGSAIDVSGLQNVPLPMSDNFLTFQPFGNEFADQPLQRNGALRGQKLTVDLRQSGTLNGVSWVGTPLADLSGYAGNVQQTIDQMLTTGGQVSLTANQSGQIVLRQGSSLNVGGGSVQYAGAAISQTRLVTADGRIVPISAANPLETYVGIAGTYQSLHPHWGDTTTQTFSDPLLTGQEFQPGYGEGHNAGAITLNATAYVVQGDLYAGVTAGERQRALGQLPAANNPQAMPQAGSFTIGGMNNLTLSSSVTPLAGNFGAQTPLSTDALATTTISAQSLSDAGFANISAVFAGHLTVAPGANLTAAPGGAINLSGGSVDIEGSLVAHAGSIAVTSTAQIAGDTIGTGSTKYVATGPTRTSVFDLVVGPAALLDVSGLWVNDNGAAAADVIGGAFINGGSISLSTLVSSSSCTSLACTSLAGLGKNVPADVDLTGDIVLSQGSLLNASSGGRITDHGQFMLDSKGRVAGTGGSVSLRTYVGAFSTGGAPLPVTTTGLTAGIVLPGSDGTPQGNVSALSSLIEAYGFAGGGTLSLQVPALDIGAAVSSGPGDLALPASYFNGNGFGAYNLTSISGHISLASNTSLTLRQRNFAADNSLLALPTGANVAQAASLDYLADFLRAPVNLTLSSNLPLIPAAPYDPAAPVPSSVIALSIGSGAAISADAGAKIALSVAGREVYLGSAHQNDSTFGPPVAAQTAVAQISGSVSAPGGSIAVTAGLNSEIWLDANSRLDVSGVALTDPRQLLFRSGAVLPGGSVSITATSGDASVIGLAGALINVSGSTGTFDLLANAAPTPAGQQRVATQVWSDAGSITLNAPTLLYDGGFLAQPGASAGNGGSLTIIYPDLNGIGTENITVRQSGNAVPAGLTPTSPLTSPPASSTPGQPASPPATLTGTVAFFADRLASSGIQNLTLSASPVTGDTVGTSSAKFSPGKVTFSGNVSLGGLNNLYIDASQIAFANTVAATDPSGCNVCLNASYIALRGAGVPNKFSPQAGKAVFQVSANTIDIAAGGNSSSGANVLAISGAAQANFISSGDIRLRIPLANAPNDLAPGKLPAGELITAGNLSLTAAQVYPVSGVDFTLKSLSLTGSISFLANGAPAAAPLSAGGQVTVSAATINQSGILVAPLGTIRLGAQTSTDLSPNDPTSTNLVPTNTVTFGAGSTTSVSLDGQTVPFGETANGASWSYDSLTGQPLTALPAKDIVVNGAAINVASGATLDLRGGGDVQAIEFVPGTGGTRDVLQGANVYAIIPGYNPGAAPIDFDFLQQRQDTLPAAGTEVYLSGGGGLPAGTYTLSPAHYATLPGAYRVSLVANSTDALSYLNQTLPDGTLRMAGYFANGASGAHDARSQYFAVQSSSVWRQYSEIDQTSGNSFFGANSASGQATASPLPADAGHAVLWGLNSINLQGQMLFAPGTGGGGGQLDIVAQDIQILSPGGNALSGYVGLNATQLSNLGVDSLLLGGIRSGSGSEQTVTVVANSVEVSNDASAPLQGPEVIMVASAGAAPGDPNAARRLMLDPGSVVEAVGAVVNPAQRFRIGAKTQTLRIKGNGSLLAVSNGSTLTVDRQDVVQNNGSLTLAGPALGFTGPGASISGASLTLDSSGSIVTGTGVTISATNISASARAISFGSTLGNGAGFAIAGPIAAQLQNAANLTLRGMQAMNFLAPTTFVMGAGSHLTLDGSGWVAAAGVNSVTLGAGTIDLVNSGTGKNPTAAGNATLNLVGSQINLDSGAISLSGFQSASISASSQIVFNGTGSLNGGAAALSFAAPLVVAAAGANQSVTTTGALNFAGTGAAAPVVTGQVGGTLAFTGQSITLAGNSDIQATGGALSLTATSGNIILGPNARIAANGFVSSFFDVTQAVGGGSVQLTANNGSIDIDSTAAIDVSSPVGQPGYAGQLALSAVNGNILSNGGAFAMNTIAGSVAGDSGGSLTIDAQSLGTSSVAIAGLYNNSINLHLRQGDLQLASDMKAASVSITVDGGALTVNHTIDASGGKGGSISLFGQTALVLTSTGNLLATASDASKNGGDIVVGAGDNGHLDLQGGLIDVSNSANPQNGGTVRLRAPLIGAAYNDVAINTVQTKIQGASSVTVEGFRVFTPENSAFQGVIDPVNNPGFFGSCTAAGACTGTLINFVQNFALSAATKARLAGIPANILHLQPGIELVNDNIAVNNGDITVASNWNLGAGVMTGYMVNTAPYVVKNKPTVPAGTVMTDANGKLLPQYAGYTGSLGFGAGFFVNAVDYYGPNGRLIAPAGTVVTDANDHLLPQYAGYTGGLVLATPSSQITDLFYRVGSSAAARITGEAGTLTLRAARDVNINASITDGFFNTRNALDPTYLKNLAAWVTAQGSSLGNDTLALTNVGGYLLAGATYYANSALGPAPVAPYDANANSVSPVSSSKDRTPLSGADLFPLIKNASGAIIGPNGTHYSAVQSWSYRIVSGANTASANPLAVQPLSLFSPGGALAGHGNVTINGHTSFTVNSPFNPSSSSVNYSTPTMVRTGTGSIDISAGLDFVLADTKAPGVVYTAGRNSVDLPDPGFTPQTFNDPVNGPVQIPVASNPQGFLKPQVVLCDPNLLCFPYGPYTQAAYPVNAGHISLTAQRDIVGNQQVVSTTAVGLTQSGGYQFFAAWLMAQGTALSSTPFGPFAPLSGYLSTGVPFTPSQTSWWINFGSFDQGVMSAGGDVRVVAGRDINQLSVSLPTTARVSGGLSSTITDAAGNVIANLPVMHLDPSGDLTVIAGRNIQSGAFYEGSGTARITAGGSVSAGWSAFNGNPVPVSTVLAVDTGKISLQARGSIDIAGIVSGPSLQNVADDTGELTVVEQAVSSYGPSSAVSLLSVAGNITTNSLTDSTVLATNSVVANNNTGGLLADSAGYPGIGAYPANFSAIAANGNIAVENGFRLASSQNGALDLLAHGSLLTAADDTNTRNQPLSTGASLVEAAFDPVNPLAGFEPQQGAVSSDLGSLLLHRNDSTPDLFYAATGDIVANATADIGVGTGLTPAPLAWEITKPAKVQAARDIVDLSFFGQNLAPGDVTSIIAGRDIYYTGVWQFQLSAFFGIPDPGVAQNLGGLSLAGPGFFEIQAGRNLGPFVTASSDLHAGASNSTNYTSDPVGTGIITFGNTVTVGNRRMFGSQADSTGNSLADPFALGMDNKLARQGADIIALFGVANGVDYNAVIKNYVDPASSTSVRDYLPALVTYLQTLGYPALSDAGAWTLFRTLPSQLQQIFADKVFMSELAVPGASKGCCYKDYAIGYAMINTMFPAALGYTDNSVTGQATPVATGSLDMLHATIKTLQSASTDVVNADGTSSAVQVGGDITIMGPGGSMNIGTTAAEINPKLTASALGLLTLDNGAISTFTDANVLVDQSRILTVQGGDILMWSSNGNLDAGRGAKTTVDLRPLSVNFDPSDLQTVNLNGLVTGAGIGTIRSTPDAPAASATLIAPRGIVNAGDAGLRATGNLDIAALQVLNAANIAVAGTVSGVPTANSVNIGALESASSSGGQAARIADDSVAATANRAAPVGTRTIPSLITVEVLGFGDCDPEAGRGCATN